MPAERLMNRRILKSQQMESPAVLVAAGSFKRVTMLQLRDYQIDISDRAVSILRAYHIVCLAVEVRCGKTLISLEAARKYGAKKVLFVTKLKAISSIQQDAAALRPGYDLTIINFESLHTIIDTFDFVIVDECHKLAGYPKPSVATKLLKQLVGVRPCILMSGTFTPESYSQIYPILSISHYSPFSEYKSFYKWAVDYVNVRSKYYYNREIKDYSQADKDKIGAATNHLFISFTQEQAGFAQEVKEEIITVKMQEGTYLLADYLRKHRVYIGRSGQELLADTEIKLLQKTWQIFSGTVITENGNAEILDYTKIDFIKEHFVGKKIAIYYVFKAEYAMILARYGYNNITDDPEVFNKSDNKVFVSQIQAGSMGINLATADCIVMLNIHYSNVLYWQVRARLQDKNRTKEAMVYWIFSEKGIEEKIYAAVKDKRDYVLNYFRKDFGIKKQYA